MRDYIFPDLSGTKKETAAAPDVTAEADEKSGSDEKFDAVLRILKGEDTDDSV